MPPINELTRIKDAVSDGHFPKALAKNMLPARSKKISDPTKVATALAVTPPERFKILPPLEVYIV